MKREHSANALSSESVAMLWNRRNWWSQAMMRSTTQRLAPKPLPRAAPRRARNGVMPSWLRRRRNSDVFHG
jgi:hypothetical protein